MPNHVVNVLKVTGKKKEVDALFKSIKGEKFDDGEERLIDFNKITEMPESLSVEPHIGIENAVKNAMNIPLHSNQLIACLEAANRSRIPSPKDFSEEDYKTFLICLDNVRKYGHISWYNWSIENWGTKWNAYSQKRINKSTIQFETAWSCVIGLMKTLAKKFPTLVLHYEWSDEDTGSNCGTATITDDLCESYSPKDQSKEAYELAFKLRPEYKKYYKLVNGEYVSKDEE
jgi:hypothetical protein